MFNELKDWKLQVTELVCKKNFSRFILKIYVRSPVANILKETWFKGYNMSCIIYTMTSLSGNG